MHVSLLEADSLAHRVKTNREIFHPAPKTPLSPKSNFFFFSLHLLSISAGWESVKLLWLGANCWHTVVTADHVRALQSCQFLLYSAFIEVTSAEPE